MARVRAHLIDANHPEAVALLRAARYYYVYIHYKTGCPIHGLSTV